MSSRHVNATEGQPPNLVRRCVSTDAGHAKKVAMLPSPDHVTRELIVHANSTGRRSGFVARPEHLDRLHGPMSGSPTKPFAEIPGRARLKHEWYRIVYNKTVALRYRRAARQYGRGAATAMD
jgi:hypothetical protein